ncbi:hypothetical protein MPRG_64380 [Mycobacterium paragordonae]|uniref:Uncharacterized protein n=1 Tax=Mycobacterium paragordonae TaxID=1389713 RepID=A0ABQ1CFN8_9MYCO|nr:hypothetical protein MPRG_64380 [Mycobacterium paragordonae]
MGLLVNRLQRLGRWSARWTIWDVLQRHRERRLARALSAETAAAVTWRRICTPTEIFTWYVIDPAVDSDAVGAIIQRLPAVRYADSFAVGRELRVRVEWRQTAAVGHLLATSPNALHVGVR